MAWFKRKTQEPQVPSIPPCRHIWKDFPWYVNTSASRVDFGWNVKISVYEPYVCVLCKERKDVLLVEGVALGYTVQEAEREVKERLEEFKDKIAPRAVIEDEINDMILVDRQKLEIYENLRRISS